MKRVSNATVYLTVKMPCGDFVNIGADLGLTDYECEELSERIIGLMADIHHQASNQIGELIQRPLLSEGLH